MIRLPGRCPAGRRLVAECERARSTPFAELPPTILDEKAALRRILARGQNPSPGGGCARRSTALESGVGTSVTAIHPQGMITALAHTLIVLAIGLTTGVWPLDPRPQLVEGFSPPATTWGSGHRGVDLLGHLGQRVRAAEAGTVTFAGRLAGRGVVVVDHGSTRTTYEPVAASVHVGDVVDAGAGIGTLQLFGSHCFPRSCLHWGLIRGTTYLDPLSLVGARPARPVRLLPLFSALATHPTFPTVAAPPLVDSKQPWWLFVPGSGQRLTRADVPAGRPLATGPW